MIIIYNRNKFLVQATGGSMVLDKFCNFYLVKNHKIANSSATTGSIEKKSTHFESLKGHLHWRDFAGDFALSLPI
jgi:hypothetical protein